MKSANDHPEIERFLDAVCRQVRAKTLHVQIKEELATHLQELVEENRAGGMNEAEAVHAAVSRMGEPARIGRELDRAHRPRTDWILIAFIAGLTALGLLALYNFQMQGSGPARYVNFFEKKTIFTGIGALLMVVFWVIDYEKIKKLSGYLFGSGVLLLIGVHEFGHSMNGQTAWFEIGPFGIYAPIVSILLFVVGLAGIKPLREQDWKGGLLLIAYRGIMPVLLLLKVNVVTMAVLYALVFIVYLGLTKKHAWQVVAYTSSGVLLVVWTLLNSHYGFMRAFGFLNRFDDPGGGDYMVTQSLNAMQSAGWWGNGDSNVRIPSVQAEGFLPYFISYFGWAAGILLIAVILGFIVKTVKSAASVRDDYGKLLFAGIASFFAIQYAWGIAMVFGFAPFVGISLPFLSYGGTDQIVQFAAIGLVLGIYRRRDMVAVSKPAQRNK
ncbi:FtsW/RodA/SpoVE family cell cycle protein [Cohnella sp. CFH 77786]|uniref:FtsW/RodA/SpoVE family cell cycle protein n=1 Tax=Cohnella sp. CFH 77786 TaxID=2662265 RepID=UPI001C60FB8C|nr:FtsW/RodA/SpoVE family cell cycle protein [Cohnella sp. CFH 77786]